MTILSMSLVDRCGRKKLGWDKEENTKDELGAILVEVAQHKL